MMYIKIQKNEFFFCVFPRKNQNHFFLPKSGQAFLKRNSVFLCFFHKKHENFFENWFIASETVPTFWQKKNGFDCLLIKQNKKVVF